MVELSTSGEKYPRRVIFGEQVQIKMKQPYASTSGSYRKGKTYFVGKWEAEMLVAKGLAEVSETDAIDAAMKQMTKGQFAPSGPKTEDEVEAFLNKVETDFATQPKKKSKAKG